MVNFKDLHIAAYILCSC